jgi:ribosomal protein L40E
MEQSGLGAYHSHHFRRVIPGDVDTVRRRLSDALEEFDYVVLGEQPIQARRGPRKNVWTANVLEYDIRLTIALKAISPVSTVATFNYEVRYLFSKGELLALEREAEAIIALSAAASNLSVCQACNTENAGAVRFCRACGTPVARNKLPAEIEVMRLTAEASGAQVEANIGLIILVATLLATLPLILLGYPKTVFAGWMGLGIGGLISLFFLFTVLLRLRRMVRPSASPDAQSELTRPLSANQRATLPPSPASVTEGTTELMEEKKIPAAVRDTGDME